MQSDLPHTLYRTKKDKNKVVVDDEAIRLQEEANRKAAARRAKNNEQQSYTIDELFAGAAEQ
jgi:hypothetical protein